MTDAQVKQARRWYGLHYGIKDPSWAEMDYLWKNPPLALIKGEIRTSFKFDGETEESKIARQIQIEKQKSWREKIESGLAYLQTKDKRLFLGKRFTKQERSERKKIITCLIEIKELNPSQTAVAINEWLGKPRIDSGSVSYVYNHTQG